MLAATTPPRTATPTDCPADLTVPSVPEASPIWSRGTELMMELELGDEKSACPSPRNMSGSQIDSPEEETPRNESARKARTLMNIPAALSRPGLILSDRAPATGAVRTITAGWTRRTRPAETGEYPRTSWR